MIQALPHDITTIDTGFQRERFDAAFLVVDGGRGAFVDTGTNHGVPRLMSALGKAGLAPEQVDFVIVTHVHLDHAGGAGLLMQMLPNARLVVHPRGARHMIDPHALYDGAKAVYGEAEMQRSYGTLVPVDPARVLTTRDGMELLLGERSLRFIDTPGHARHHHCIWDQRTRGFFTGDTFGLSYREFDTAQGPWVLPTTTPVQFEPEALRHSVRRMLDQRPACMYLTHYGRVGDVQRLGALLLSQLDEIVALATPLAEAPDRHQALEQALAGLYLRRLREHGCRLAEERILDLLSLDIELNAQGLGVWLDRLRARQSRP